jgi:small-conductance mechanosensitive channel
VKDIQARATIIATPDGHRIFIPNAVLFTNPVTVASPFGKEQAPKQDLEAAIK